VPDVQAASVAPQWFTAGAAAVALLGVLLTLIVNGIRAERQRRRDLHARALAAIVAYGEMPFRIRRRAPGPEARARLCDELSLVKTEADVCQVLLAAEGDEKLSDAFDDLYAIARRTVGVEGHEAWKAPVIEDDEGMNMGPLYRRLRPFNDALDGFADDLRKATQPRTRRISRRIRSVVPFMRRPKSAADRRIVAPQDELGEDLTSSPT
jgi:hypothetical protein